VSSSSFDSRSSFAQPCNMSARHSSIFIPLSLSLSLHREHLILFNPAASPQTKEFSIRRVITAGLVSQFLGGVVSFASHNDAWIFDGIVKFLQYGITTGDDDDNGANFRWQEVLFINEAAATEKGEESARNYRTRDFFQCHTFFSCFPCCSCMHFSHDL
jgi:hypothetical protein